jgi:hypothetical protein
LFAQDPSLPNHDLTPGVARHVYLSDVCGNKLDIHRQASEKAYKQIMARYGVNKDEYHKYEIDYLIPLSLGGSCVMENMWAQPADDVYRKNYIEGRLLSEVCDGRMTLRRAQDLIKDDWKAAYRIYFDD